MHGADTRRVAFEHMDLAAACCIPNHDGPIGAGGCQPVAFWAPTHGVLPARTVTAWALPLENHRSGLRLPDQNASPKVLGGDPPAIRTPECRAD